MEKQPAIESEQDVLGRWRGKLVDVLGLRGDLKLRLEKTEEGISGRFQIRLRVHDYVHTIEGYATGRVTDSSVELFYDSPQDQSFRFSGQVRPTAEEVGELSLVGCYEMESQARPSSMPLRGGAMILWKG
jgi:hypothetical protein